MRAAAPGATPSPAGAGGIADPKVSLTRSVAQLLPAASAFRDKTSCISSPQRPAVDGRRRRSTEGRRGEQALDRKNLDDQIGFFKRLTARVMSGDAAVGGEALTVGYTQLGLAAAGHPLDTVTAIMTHWVMARQMPDGSWLGNGLNRPPLEYSIISHTAMAAGGLAAYPLPGRQRDVTESLSRAKQWLLAADPKSAEERGMRLLGLVWTSAPKPRIAEAITAIRARQEADGGWSQFSRTEPDAYATGLTLYALLVAGVPASDRRIAKASRNCSAASRTARGS
jgi:hypothetical protein